MKKTLALAAALMAATAIAGCASYGDDGDYFGPGPVAAVDYDGYYDGAYGPVYDGYWGADGGYYYRSRGEHTWHHDDGGHFSRQAANNMHPFHGGAHMAPGGAHGGGGHGGGDHHG